jgi:hypothetical protein
MDKANIASDKKIIEYKIESISVINHSEKHFSEYGLKSSDIKNGYCEIGINIKIDADKSCIAIPVKVIVSLKHENNKYELFSTEAIYTFRIKRFKTQFETNEHGKYMISDTLMRTLIGTAMGGMRGIMVASNTIAEYRKIILPLIDTSSLLNTIKKAQSSVNQP